VVDVHGADGDGLGLLPGHLVDHEDVVVAAVGEAVEVRDDLVLDLAVAAGRAADDAGELELGGLEEVVRVGGVVEVTIDGADAGIEGRDLIVVVGGVVGVADGHLAQVGLRGHDAGRLAGLAEGREQDPDEQGDDRDDHQKFDQCKCVPLVHGFPFHSLSGL
jgi:hypothetical protein